MTDECKQYGKATGMDVKSEQSLDSNNEGCDDLDGEGSDESVIRFAIHNLHHALCDSYG